MKQLIGLLIISLTIFAGCGGGSENSNQSSEQTSAKKSSGGLTAFEQENGIGPVTENIKLDKIDKTLAKKGEGLFETKCSACHKLDERYVGPAQRDLLDRRSPEYIMNMILNPAGMVEKHPEAKKMLAEFMTPMPNQNLSREEARSILEYFRYMNKHKDIDEIQ